MKGKIFLLLGILVCIAGLSGCSSGGGSVIVLLPDDDGRVGKVEVTNSEGSYIIDRKHETLSLKSQENPESSGIMPETEINSLFEAALAAQPVPPASFFLNFKLGSDEIVQESLPMMQLILADIQKRDAPQIVIKGHADTSGADQVNYKLSEKRAEKIKGLLVNKGAIPEFIQMTSHGEEMPLVKTADDVPNLINRRVEVIVR